jgi:hypothetical protein
MPSAVSVAKMIACAFPLNSLSARNSLSHLLTTAAVSRRAGPSVISRRTRRLARPALEKQPESPEALEKDDQMGSVGLIKPEFDVLEFQETERLI